MAAGSLFIAVERLFDPMLVEPYLLAVLPLLLLPEPDNLGEAARLAVLPLFPPLPNWL
jgi:hypothetical protein